MAGDAGDGTSGCTYVCAGELDDPDAFLRFLEKHMLSSMPGHAMVLRQQERHLVGLPGGPVFAKPLMDAEKTLGAPGAPVHGPLA